MKPIAAATIGLGMLAASLGAAAAPAAPGVFHGVQVLASSGTELSGGPRQTNERTLGPFGTDAVVFLTWTGEVDYGAAHGLAEPRITVRYDGKVAQAKDARVTVSGAGSAFRVIDGDQLFLRKGQATTISLVVEDDARLDGVPARAVARLNTLAIAARD